MNQICSFCGRNEDEAGAFFRPQGEVSTTDGRPLFICDHCVEGCHRRLAEKSRFVIERAEKQQFREWLNESLMETLVRAIVDMKHREELMATFAERAQLARITPEEAPQAVALAALPASFARDNRILPWRIEDDHLVVAFYNPLHLLDIYDEVVQLAGMAIRPALLGREQLLSAIEQYCSKR